MPDRKFILESTKMFGIERKPWIAMIWSIVENKKKHNFTLHSHNSLILVLSLLTGINNVTF